MYQRLKKVLVDTKEVWSAKWTPEKVQFGSWAIKALMWIVTLRSITYGIETFVQWDNPVSPYLAFADVMGLGVWGLLMIIGAAMTIIGLLTKNLILITVATLINTAVWFTFGGLLCVGWSFVGAGGRFAVSALCTSAVWFVMYLTHLRAIKRDGSPQ